MNISDAGVMFCIAASLTASAGAGGKYYLDNEYATVGSVEEAFLKRDIRYLKREIRRLEYLKGKGKITDEQEWDLEGYKQELEELTQ